MKYLKYVFGAIVAIFGFIFYTKSKSAEALLENHEVNKELNKADQTIAKNDGLLEAEEQKRKEAEEKKADAQNLDSVDYFNKYYNRDNK